MTERECYERAAKACEALRYLPNGMRLAADEVSTDDCAAAIRALAPSGTTADERDAARYRWIRLADNNGPRTRAMQYHHVEHLDAAIDAALAESALPGQQDGDVSAGDDSPNRPTLVCTTEQVETALKWLDKQFEPSKADELLRELVRIWYAGPYNLSNMYSTMGKARAYLDGSAHGG